MKVCIIRYNAGNTESVRNAVMRIGAEPIVSSDPNVITKADKVIFPGVGEASTAMKYLTETGLAGLIPKLTQPVFGICLGMQLFCRWSAENDTELLGLTDLNVRRFEKPGLRVPHVGWNRLNNLRGPLFEGVDEGEYVYFVHSYFVPKNEATIATCEYGHEFAAAIQVGNFYGVQFHTEKSGRTGEFILRNFLSL